MEIKDVIKEWKELGITNCEMEFSCGGDSMNDFSFTFYNKDNEKVETELNSFFEDEVFRRVEFYECSDGHYLGEFGNVNIELNDDEDDFEYAKTATSEFSESFTDTMKIEVSQKEMDFIKEKVSNINGSDWNDKNVNYKIDFVLTDEDETMMEDLLRRIDEEAQDFHISEAYGEPEESYNWETDGIEFEDGKLLVSVTQRYLVTQDSDN